MAMTEADQLEVLRVRLKTVLDWGREELDLNFIGLVGLLDALKFELLCEMYGLEDEDEDEEENCY